MALLDANGKRPPKEISMMQSVQAHLNAIANWFDDPKVTLVIRANGQDLILTNDTTESAVDALQTYDETKKVN